MNFRAPAKPLCELAITGFGLLDLALGAGQEAGGVSIPGFDGPQDAADASPRPPSHHNHLVIFRHSASSSDRITRDPLTIANRSMDGCQDTGSFL